MIEKDQRLIDMKVLEQSAAVMRVLAHPHRLRICELLMAGRVSVGDLARQLGIASNAVSQHLNMMKAHGLLTCEREGKAVYYGVCDPRPAWLLQCIRNHACGKQRL
ncbi:MAG TPA: metalloregulator ArsR/SmtB family transcription factor [Phycisphaerae bacterium]|nr:metalloregulator ArsR/SmtB family transcription factor [Phycisphaerae bacterium]HRR86286.1 metalloregulator ArsR/SmtB family transcription factor [Phycisphaerae bacterium]